MWSLSSQPLWRILPPICKTNPALSCFGLSFGILAGTWEGLDLVSSCLGGRALNAALMHKNLHWTVTLWKYHRPSQPTGLGLPFPIALQSPNSDYIPHSCIFPRLSAVTPFLLFWICPLPCYFAWWTEGNSGPLPAADLFTSMTTANECP